jgi:hypothetical protein
MSCEEVRLRIGADPQSASEELADHVRGCAACGAFREQMQRLDADIRRALEQPPAMPVRRRAAAAPPRWREWALAASVLLATAAAVSAWLLRPTDALAHEVVMHVKGEPDSWLSSHNVSVGAIDHSLRRSGIGLDFASDRIVYAQSCWFRGHYVPHLVIQTAQGPATVLILRHVQVGKPDYFHESGMSGVIVPAGDGSIAVLERGAGPVAELAGELRQEVHWLPEPKDPA